jgi:MYXO-CTERM domain-containing protein
MRHWVITVALTLACFGTSAARAEPFVNGLADRSSAAARVLRHGAPVLPASRLDNSPSVLRPADETDTDTQTLEEEPASISPLGALVVLAFIPSYYLNNLSSQTQHVGWPDVVPRGTDTVNNTGTTHGTIGDTSPGSGDTPSKTGTGHPTDSGTLNQTPEPATLLSGLIGLGAVGLGGLRRRRRRT